MFSFLTKFNKHTGLRYLPACRHLVTSLKGWTERRNVFTSTQLLEEKMALTKARRYQPKKKTKRSFKNIKIAYCKETKDVNPQKNKSLESFGAVQMHGVVTDHEKSVETPQIVRLDETLSANIREFCDKFRISKKMFVKLMTKFPKARRIETIQHLSKAADVLTEYGYGSGVKFFLNKYANMLNRTSIEHLRSVLDEHHGAASSKTRKSTREILEKFPFHKLTDESSNIFEFFVNYFEVDEKVILACWHPIWVLKSKANQSLYEERVNILADAGVNKMEILENPNIVMKCKTVQLVKAIEEQKNIFGKVNLNTLEAFLLPSGRKSRKIVTLSFLFDCSFSQFSTEEKAYFKDKSKVNTAKVFYLLIDEGFQKEEIRKYVFLLGFEESLIQQYLKDNGKVDPSVKMAQILEEKSSKEETVSVVDTLPDIGNNFESNGLCFHDKTEREKYLQTMQIALEFHNSS